MTANQINYLRAQEDNRTHLEQERQGRVALAETERSNREREATNWFTARSTNSHYIRMDTETRRHNRETEWEASRHNRESESLGRANLAETQLHNRRIERETHRSNLANEFIRSSSLQLEQQRISLARQQQAETQRSNLAREELQRQTNAEIQRSNLARELELQRSNMARETEAQRSNVARERETERSNRRSESLRSEALFNDRGIAEARNRTQLLATQMSNTTRLTSSAVSGISGLGMAFLRTRGG